MLVDIGFDKETVAREETQSISSLRAERQRTGRYVALGTAISLFLLGLYQAVANGTPQYAALFAPALIMFIYILWILNASASQRKKMLRNASSTDLCERDSTTVVEMGMDQPAKVGHKPAARFKKHADDQMATTSVATSDTDRQKEEEPNEDVALSTNETTKKDVNNSNERPESYQTRFYSRSYSIA